MVNEKKILVTGAGGQLGQEIVRLNAPGMRFVGLDRSELDITDADACRETVSRLNPFAIIHAAAYTAVDRAESEPERAQRVNVDGTRYMAEAAQAVGAKFCYVSTDYVFDGRGDRPYREDDETGPQTVYGRTKLEGERAALMSCEKTFVVRTSWVYGPYGANFVKTMLNVAKQGKPLTVVDDQTGSPTHTLDLARFLAELVQTEKYGTYHASNIGTCTWYQFAQAIFEESGLKVDLAPCSTEQFPRPAPRPKYSVLAHDALARAGFSPMRPWRDALRDYLQRE